MSFRKNQRSVLLKTSSISSLLHSGGNVNIAGLDGGPIRYNDILDVKQIKYRAEVSQVVTVADALTAPSANTTYAIEVNVPSMRVKGWQGYKKKYAYTTPSVITVIGASAALQREYINGQIIDKINNDPSNFLTAATLTGGAGFTLTDDAGYYPARVNGASNGRGGATAIYAITNSDGSGWTTSSNVTVTTAAVYSFGEGSRMDDDIPVIHGYSGNLVSGELDAPKAADGTYATAGQKYDAIIITSMGVATAHAVSDQLAHTLEETVVFVDNGTGTSTTNLTGFTAFEKTVHRLIGSLYAANPNAIVEFFDTIGTFSGASTPAPTGATGDVNQMNTGKNVFQYFIKGAGSTILAPYASTTGLPIVLDATDDEGMELSAPVGSNSPIGEFIVGQQEFSLFARVNIDDISGTDAFYCGFRKKEAHQADANNYDEMAALALDANAGALKIATILNNAGTVATATGDTWADTNTKDLELRVLIDGTVKFYVDGVDRSSVQTTAFAFDAGEVVIPFITHLNTSDLATVKLRELLVLPTIAWKA